VRHHTTNAPRRTANASAETTDNDGRVRNGKGLMFIRKSLAVLGAIASALDFSGVDFGLLA